MNDPENMKVFFEFKKRIHHLRLSHILPMHQFKILEIIQEYSKDYTLHGKQICGMRVNDLFDYIHVSRPAISKALKDCEQKGYILRYVSEKDKRYTYVCMSEQGKDIFKQATSEVIQSVDWISSQFNEEEKKNFLNMLMKINNVLYEFERRDKSCGD